MIPIRNLFLFFIALFSIETAHADIYSEATDGHTKEVNAAYFGVHFHRLQLRPQEKAIQTEWPPLAFGTVRLWDSTTRWADLAPSPGTWNFERLDTYINTIVAHGATVLYTLGSTPQWISAKPSEKCPYGFGCGAAPVRIAHWEEYIRRIVQRYGDRIAAYELWNEPKFSDLAKDRNVLGFFTGSIAEMVDMARTARHVLDENASKALLCTPGFVNGPDRLEKFLAAGGKNYVQAVCYHFYAESSRHFVEQVLEIRKIMQRQGIGSLPLWNTETGVDTLAANEAPSGISALTREESVSRLTQMLILGAAAGLDHFYYYAWDNERSGMVASNGVPLFGYEVMQRLQSWLIGSQLTGCNAVNNLVQCNGVNRDNKFILIWAEKPTKYSITLPPGFQIASVENMYGEITKVSTARGLPDMFLSLGPLPLRINLSYLRSP